MYENNYPLQKFPYLCNYHANLKSMQISINEFKGNKGQSYNSAGIADNSKEKTETDDTLAANNAAVSAIVAHALVAIACAVCYFIVPIQIVKVVCVPGALLAAVGAAIRLRDYNKYGAK